MTEIHPPFRRPALWWGLFALAQLSLLLSSMLPMPESPFEMEHWDKWGHVFAHLGLAAFAVMIARTARGRLLLLAWLLLLGLAIEGLQGLVPWRSMEAADLLANVVGTSLGALLALTPLRNALRWLDLRMGRSDADSARR